MNNKLKSFLEKDSTFILLLGILSAGMVGGTNLFLQNGTGLFSDIFLGEMLNASQKTGDFTTPAAFAVGFLIARILEGPLVGILDIGGSIMTGVGVGIPALLLSAGLGFLINNFGMSLLTGFLVGVILGGIMIVIRKMAYGLSMSTATSIMMGAGNQSGSALGPLVLLSAVSYNIPVGVGALIGSALFYKYKRPIVGGAILGAIFVGGIYLLLGGTLPETN